MGSSLRQLRRQKARQDAKSMEAWKNRSVNERKMELMKQGISSDDLNKAYNDGHTQGFKDGRDTTFTTVLAAFCLAANELYGFGQGRLFRLAQKADEYMVMFIDEQEAIQAVYDATGLEFQSENPFNRVNKTKRKRGKALIQVRNGLTKPQEEAE